MDVELAGIKQILLIKVKMFLNFLSKKVDKNDDIY